MEKVDLLVHVQKLQLELEHAKDNKSHEKDQIIDQLKSELAAKDMECKKWIAKIEIANDLADDLSSKEKEIEQLNQSLDFEKNKRKHIEQMFQDLQDTQMKDRKSGDGKVKEVEELKSKLEELNKQLKAKDHR